MTVAASSDLDDRRFEIIQEDGSVGLELNAKDGAQDDRTWTWAVADQPWAVGDKLMVRIKVVNPQTAR